MELSDEESADANRFADAEDDIPVESHAYGLTTAAQAALTHPTNPSHWPPPSYEPFSTSGEAAISGAGAGAGAGAVQPVHINPAADSSRGKPQAMAVALAASHAEGAKKMLEAERIQAAIQGKRESIENVAMAVEAQPALPGTPMEVEAVAVAEPAASADAVVIKPPPKKKRKTPSKKSTPSKKPAESPATKLVELSGPSLDDPVDPITEAEYKNLDKLLEHFCKVPLLAEFSRPVILLHPELMTAYSKIVSHPIDLGKVCRKVRRREYENTRQVQLDMWRIFANCVKYHSHPSNKEGVPSFVSIALHLREFFNNLFQEWMLPSDPPPEALTVKGTSASVRYLRETYATREEDRKRRLIVSGLTCMSIQCMIKSAAALQKLLDSGGCVDDLDQEPILPRPGEIMEGLDDADQRDLQLVVHKLMAFKEELLKLAASNTEYTVEQFERELKSCFMEDVFEFNSALKYGVRNRINRFLHKILCPINEANCRGVTQSSIWGCMGCLEYYIVSLFCYGHTLINFSEYYNRPQPFGLVKVARNPSGQPWSWGFWHPTTKRKIGTGPSPTVMNVGFPRRFVRS